MIKAFTAATARRLVNEDEKLRKLIEEIHSQIYKAAKKGLYEIDLSFSMDAYDRQIHRKAKDFLEKEGYHVAMPMPYGFMLIDWRE